MIENSGLTPKALCKEELESVIPNIEREEIDFDSCFIAAYDPKISIEKIQEELKSKIPISARTELFGTNVVFSQRAQLQGERVLLDAMQQNLTHANGLWDVVAATNMRTGNPIKTKLRNLVMKFLGWPTRRYLRVQTEFNSYLVRAQNESYNVQQMLLTRIEAQNEKIISQEDEITSLSVRLKNGISEIESYSEFLKNAQLRIDAALELVQNQLGAPSDFDYVGFENKYRGDWKEIQNRIRDRYYSYYSKCKNVLDLGCGRGEFLALLQNNGIQALGVDMSQEMIDYCTRLGLTAEKKNAIEYVENEIEADVDGIFCAQMIEHLSSVELMRFIRGCYAHLQTGGVIALETINPLSLATHRLSYPLDFTHRRFVHPYTLKFILESVGFSDVKIEYYTPVRELPAFEDNMSNEIIEFMSDIQNALFSEQDYAVIARK